MAKDYSFYEFFAGGGMARAGLGKRWQCVFANDLDEMKCATYAANWGSDHLHAGDLANVAVSSLPGTADLAWASFPCQDLSLAGNYKGLGKSGDNAKTRSGTFWLFHEKIRTLGARNRLPKTIVLENVYGTITSHKGRDFSAIIAAVARLGYRLGAMVIDARWFLPQSRPRVFILAVRKDLEIPGRIEAKVPITPWHPTALVTAKERLSRQLQDAWIWWDLPRPGKISKNLADIIEHRAASMEWDHPEKTAYLLEIMSELNKSKIESAKKAAKITVGTLYRRTRPDEHGVKRQRAEVRFDNIAGCLRTPAGGSSRQSIMIVERKTVRTRLLSPREAARLMGIPDEYRLPVRYNDAYHVCGDGVAVPVVRHIAKNLLEPILSANSGNIRVGAE